ncbi:hypothetical protein ABZ816_01325 [Actinosynnema sp. NPDC047251]|nr:hypothetical protein [Saccharothrix espanaensis]
MSRTRGGQHGALPPPERPGECDAVPGRRTPCAFLGIPFGEPAVTDCGDVVGDRVAQVGLRPGRQRPARRPGRRPRAAGNHLVTAWDLPERGAGAVPGRLTYPQIRTLVGGLARDRLLLNIVGLQRNP